MDNAVDPAVLLTLHSRLLAGDRVASGTLCGILLAPLQAELQRRFPGTDDQVISDGVIDAVLDYCTRPGQFDLDRTVPLDRFLATAAWRNIDNLLRGETRRKIREQKAGRKKREPDDALDPAAGNTQRADAEQAEKTMTAMLSVLIDPKDREMLVLRAQGVRSTAAYARILEITHLPLKEQRVAVKRHKERIIRFLRRKGFAP